MGECASVHAFGGECGRRVFDQKLGTETEAVARVGGPGLKGRKDGESPHNIRHL